MRVDVSGKAFAFPPRCVCCGRAPNTEMFASATLNARTGTWRFPACSHCLHHVATWQSAEGYAQGFMLLGIGVGLVSMFVIGAWGLVCGVVATIGLRVWARRARENDARSQCFHECASPWRAVSYLGWVRSVESFHFAQPGYALDFMRANLKKLINVSPEARRLLHDDFVRDAMEAAAEQRAIEEQRRAVEAQRVAEQQAREEQKRLLEAQRAAERRALEQQRAAERERLRAEAEIARENADYAKWLSKLEAAKGPAGRRASLEGGLRALKQRDLRDRFLLEASRVEVHAAIDKAEGLKSPGAKLRTLQAALDAIQNDPVPDELQAHQIRWLADAIAEIEDKKNSIDMA